ncbi:Retrotransposon gag protein [Pyrenophora tritici-repentis]|nr:Retrotransposon gag protein [Pyrenophora tritici-repentis]
MRLDGAAKTNVTTYYEIQVKEESPNPFKLLDRLELLYGERNRKEKAIQNLYSIRQKDDETFISFYPRKSNNATLTAVSPEDMMEWEPTQPTTTQVNAVGLRGKTNMNGYPSRRPEDRELQ